MTFIETRKMIRISPDCHKRLNDMKEHGDTFEDVIVCLMDLADRVWGDSKERGEQFDIDV